MLFAHLSPRLQKIWSIQEIKINDA